MAEAAVTRNGLPQESYVLVLYGSTGGDVHELEMTRAEFMELKSLLSMACSNYSMQVLEKGDKRLVMYARVRRIPRSAQCSRFLAFKQIQALMLDHPKMLCSGTR